MAAGVSDRLWEVSDIVALLEAAEPRPGKRGPYKKARRNLALRYADRLGFLKTLHQLGHRGLFHVIIDL